MRQSASLLWAIVCAAACATLALPAHAAEPDKVEAVLAPCAGCHGAEGLPKDPTVPIIWGQKADYLAKQLNDYRSGDRDSQIMSSMAESVPFPQIARAAELLSQRAWPTREASHEGAPGSLEVCKGCHGADLMGGPSPEGVAPRLAGQFAEYLDYEMGAFAREERSNKKTMTSTMKALSPAERTALAHWLAGQ